MIFGALAGSPHPCLRFRSAECRRAPSTGQRPWIGDRCSRATWRRGLLPAPLRHSGHATGTLSRVPVAQKEQRRAQDDDPDPQPVRDPRDGLHQRRLEPVRGRADRRPDRLHRGRHDGPVRRPIRHARRVRGGDPAAADRRQAHHRDRQPGLPAVLRRERRRPARPLRGSSATRPTARASRAPSRTPSPTSWASPRTRSQWTYVPFDNSFKPGPKTFDIDINQVSDTARARAAVDLSDGYYFVNQAVVVAGREPDRQGHHRSPISRASSSAPRSGRRASRRSPTSSSRPPSRASTTRTTPRSRRSRPSRSTASSSTCRPPST